MPARRKCSLRTSLFRWLTFFFFPSSVLLGDFRLEYFADSAGLSQYGLPDQQKKEGKEESKAVIKARSSNCYLRQQQVWKTSVERSTNSPLQWLFIVDIGGEMKKSLNPFSSVKIFKDFYHIDKMLKLFTLKFQFLESMNLIHHSLRTLMAKEEFKLVFNIKFQHVMKFHFRGITVVWFAMYIVKGLP